MSRNFDDMTEDEILGEALGAIPEYLERIRQTGRFDLEECVRLELGRIEKLFRGRRGRARVPNMPRPLSFRRDEAAAKAEKDALEALLAHFRGTLTQRTIPVRDRYLRSRKVSEINAVTAKSVITARLKEAGYEGEVTGQRYRARVEVRVARGYMLRFYVYYKNVCREGFLDGVIRAVGRIREDLESLGHGAVLKKG
ncbi:MAG: hypothetical protein II518_02985 [Candidatus Methanomethylophilus sp.]|nr:hypothetical protein [Methanomethylophilus sp.]